MDTNGQSCSLICHGFYSYIPLPQLQLRQRYQSTTDHRQRLNQRFHLLGPPPVQLSTHTQQHPSTMCDGIIDFRKCPRCRDEEFIDLTDPTHPCDRYRAGYKCDTVTTPGAKDNAYKRPTNVLCEDCLRLQNQQLAAQRHAAAAQGRR